MAVWIGCSFSFPDPWHKKRHNKPRVVNAEFLELLCRKLKPGGIFHAATHWAPYAEHMAETLLACHALCSLTADSIKKPQLNS